MEEIHPTADQETKDYYKEMEDKLKGSPGTGVEEDITGYR